LIERVKINRLNDYFLKLSQRNPQGVFFCRIDQYSDELKEFLKEFIGSIKNDGIWIDQKMKNPDENQLMYYENIIGSQFNMDGEFIKRCIKLMFGNLSENQIEGLSQAVFHELTQLLQAGKNINIIKNAFVKFMCWFYYKFKPVIGAIGSDVPPKIVYFGEISNYEFIALTILSHAGCDVVLLNYGGEEKYKSVDASLRISERLQQDNGQGFPPDFSILAIKKSLDEEQYLDKLYRKDQLYVMATNTWLSGDIFSDLLLEDGKRGNGIDIYYNAFLRMTGVENKTEYCMKLFHLKTELEKKGKTVYIEEKIAPPTPEEVQKIQPGNYRDTIQMLTDLARKIGSPYPRLRNQIQKAFVDCIVEESKNEEENLPRLKNKAVYLVAWFHRYAKYLFTKEKNLNLPVFIYFGTCKNVAETLLLRFFASLPLDVFVINPNTQKVCMLTDSRLFDRNYEDSIALDKFPVKIEDVNYGTVAYHAEQDLNSLLYQDSGMYRNQQYKDAVAVTLKTMYEELYLLWDQEVNLRPSFEIIQDKVVIPTILTKVTGVKNQDVGQYWKDIKKLLVEDTILIDETSFYKSSGEKFDSKNAIKNGVLQKESIFRNRNYKYGIFREEIQEYMLNKLQELLDSKLIYGTFTAGVEHSIISIVMDLDKNITRLIQKMDFTKKNPKLVLTNTGETEYGLEESIILAYLHFIGFDIALFVPTGYRLIKKHYTQPFFVEHQIGEFMYDLKIPMSVQGNRLREQEQREGFLKKLFNI
jgi:YceG-like Ter operon protein